MPERDGSRYKGSENYKEGNNKSRRERDAQVQNGVQALDHHAPSECGTESRTVVSLNCSAVICEHSPLTHVAHFTARKKCFYSDVTNAH